MFLSITFLLYHKHTFGILFSDKGNLLMLELYRNIKKFRKLNSWSQEELALKIGYTDRSIIAKIENGKIDLPQSKIQQFAKVFGVPANVLMGDDGCETKLTQDELELIQKYRCLDRKGQLLVETILDREIYHMANLTESERRVNIYKDLINKFASKEKEEEG